MASAAGRLEPHLTTVERVVAFVIALVLGLLALVFYLDPPDRSQAVEGCQAEEPAQCVVEVDDASTTAVAALTAIGGASLVIGLLGIRFTTVKAGPVELGGVATEQKPEAVATGVAEGKLEQVAPVAAATAAGGVWAELPQWVRSALHRWVADNPITDLPLEDAVTAAYKPSGQGNYAWSVTLATPNGDRTLRVSQGRGSSQAAMS